MKLTAVEYQDRHGVITVWRLDEQNDAIRMVNYYGDPKREKDTLT